MVDTINMTAALYGRRSHDRNDFGKGLDAQIGEIKQFADYKGFVVPEKRIYIEDDVSGAANNRKKLNEMLEAANRGEIKNVLVYMYDRFSRDPVFGISTVRTLKAKGVAVISRPVLKFTQGPNPCYAGRKGYSF
jgi:DNA invertase Pin-like site-specific DNA recombinase